MKITKRIIALVLRPSSFVSSILCLSIVSTAFCGGRAVGADLVPFVIPAKPNPDSAIAAPPTEPIATNSPRLLVSGGHFHRAGKRVRLWGVNLSFGANFPTHEAAKHIAARMAAVGVNTVRCHHMDTARWPRGIWNAKDGKDIAPEALDRLDFFIDQLAGRGICVNINLHVGRAHSEYLDVPETTRNYDKVTNIFTPALIKAQKKYARELLTHVNPYRKVRYADDPAIAFVEITNENSFFMWDGEKALRNMPEHYAKILQGRFNNWLKKQYGSDSRLRTAWSKGIDPLGENMLRNGRLESHQAGSSIPEHWNMEQHDGCKAWCSRQRLESQRALKIDIEKADDTEWHLQFNQRGLALKKGRYYTIAFEAAADKPRSITCGVSQAGSPWDNLGLSQQVELTVKRTTYRYGFTAKADEDNARLSFSFGGSEIPIQLANIELCPGGRTGLKEDESLGKGNITLFAQTESPQRTLDRMKFLAETEKAYFDGMRSFIKKDLKCGALVTGTIVFGPLGLYAQSDMDFIDGHAYWQHPRFPGRPWDQGNWLVDQKPMTDHPEQATLFRLAAQRLAGKPYTVSEYNHPAPLDSQAECVPMIASFAAAQDWDGIWLYTYSHSSDDWDRENMNGFFDIDTNPAKWGFMRSGTAIFRDAGIEPAEDSDYVPLAKSQDLLTDLARYHLLHDRDMFALLAAKARINRDHVLNARLFASFSAKPPAPPGLGTQAALYWTGGEEARYYVLGAGAVVIAAGKDGANKVMADSGTRFSGPAFMVLTAVTLDGRPINDSSRILLTVCGRCENTAMKFSEDRRTVGRNWGRAPVLIEPVEGTLVLPEGTWTCRALGPDGIPRQKVPVIDKDGDDAVELSAEYKTMWYLLTRP